MWERSHFQYLCWLLYDSIDNTQYVLHHLLYSTAALDITKFNLVDVAVYTDRWPVILCIGHRRPKGPRWATVVRYRFASKLSGHSAVFYTQFRISLAFLALSFIDTLMVETFRFVVDSVWQYMYHWILYRFKYNAQLPTYCTSTHQRSGDELFAAVPNSLTALKAVTLSITDG